MQPSRSFHQPFRIGLLPDCLSAGARCDPSYPGRRCGPSCPDRRGGRDDHLEKLAGKTCQNSDAPVHIGPCSLKTRKNEQSALVRDFGRKTRATKVASRDAGKRVSASCFPAMNKDGDTHAHKIAAIRFY